MPKPVASEPIHSDSIVWVDTPIEVDENFKTSEIGIEIAEKTAQAFFEPVTGDVLKKLFAFDAPKSWALFCPFQGYFFRLRRMFKKKVLNSFDPESSIEYLDEAFEEGRALSEDEGEKIYEMLYMLRHLNDVLESVYLKIWSCLKS